MLVKNQSIKYYGQQITLLERAIIPVGDALIPFWIYSRDNSNTPTIGSVCLTTESDLLEILQDGAQVL